MLGFERQMSQSLVAENRRKLVGVLEPLQKSQLLERLLVTAAIAAQSISSCAFWKISLECSM
jgi:hypothetical protein